MLKYIAMGKAMSLTSWSVHFDCQQRDQQFILHRLILPHFDHDSRHLITLTRSSALTAQRSHFSASCSSLSLSSHSNTRSLPAVSLEEANAIS